MEDADEWGKEGALAFSGPSCSFVLFRNMAFSIYIGMEGRIGGRRKERRKCEVIKQKRNMGWVEIK